MNMGKKLIVVMGVSGTGKSTVSEILADLADCPCIEGDDHHPVDNIQSMKSGRPLSDADRVKWLDNIVAAIRETGSDTIVLACSALTPYVQEQLTVRTDCQIMWAMLDGPRELIRSRMEKRQHFMPPTMLDSQLEALQAPANAHIFSIEANPAEIAESILTAHKKH